MELARINNWSNSLLRATEHFALSNCSFTVFSPSVASSLNGQLKRAVEQLDTERARRTCKEISKVRYDNLNLLFLQFEFATPLLFVHKSLSLSLSLLLSLFLSSSPFLAHRLSIGRKRFWLPRNMAADD